MSVVSFFVMAVLSAVCVRSQQGRGPTYHARGEALRQVHRHAYDA